MISIEDLVKKPPVYLDNFTSRYDVMQEFFPEIKETWDYVHRKYISKPKEFIAMYRENEHILFAYYSYENYSGEAFVLFEQDGKLFEVNGSHCSCNGLEDQWFPEETTIEALAERVKKGKNRWEYGAYYPALREFLEVLESEVEFKEID